MVHYSCKVVMLGEGGVGEGGEICRVVSSLIVFYRVVEIRD